MRCSFLAVQRPNDDATEVKIREQAVHDRE